MAIAVEERPVFDVLIVGGGCAGLAAAMYAGRFELKTLVVSEMIGGTITLTDVVENYPGFKSISGYDLAKNLENHAREYPSVQFEDGRVTAVAKCAEHAHDGAGCWKAVVQGGKEFHAKTLVFATGTEWKKLGVPGEKEFANRGVHYCALCDGAFYAGKVLAVVGGSDTAVKDAVLLTQWAKKVFVIYRGEKVRAEPITVKRLQQSPMIEVLNKANVLEIRGAVSGNVKFARASSVLLDRDYAGCRELAVDGVFVAIGHNVLSSLAVGLGVKANAKGEIIVDRHGRTNVPSVFAAGDVVDTEFKQAITGASEGVLAAYSAYQYVNDAKQKGAVKA